MRPMVKDIVFDFYGTLVGYSHESVRDGERNAYEFLLSQNYEIDYSEYRKWMNQSYFELMKEAQAHHREFSIEDISRRFMENAFDVHVNEKFAKEFGRIHVEEWNQGTRFFEGMKEFIEEMGSKYRLSIISNTHCPQIVKRNLQSMGLEDRFAHVTTSIEFGMRKPHKSIFEHTLAKLGVSASEAVFVGDTYEDDFVASKNAGMISFLIDSDGKRPELADERLDHIFDLKTRLPN